MKKKISELFKDPYIWGLMVCGWASVYFGFGGVALVIGTAWVTQKRMERLFDERIHEARVFVVEGRILVAVDEEED